MPLQRKRPYPSGFLERVWKLPEKERLQEFIVLFDNEKLDEFCDLIRANNPTDTTVELNYSLLEGFPVGYGPQRFGAALLANSHVQRLRFCHEQFGNDGDDQERAAVVAAAAVPMLQFFRTTKSLQAVEAMVLEDIEENLPSSGLFLKAISENPHGCIQEVTLDRWDRTSAPDFCQFLQDTKSLKTLTFPLEAFETHEEAALVASVLGAHETIESVTMIVDDSEFLHLYLEKLAGHKTLLSLGLTEMTREEGATVYENSVPNFLVSSPILRELALEDFIFCRVFMQRVTDSVLASGPSLQKLSLNRCFLDEEATAVLNGYLGGSKTETSISELGIMGCDIEGDLDSLLAAPSGNSATGTPTSIGSSLRKLCLGDDTRDLIPRILDHMLDFWETTKTSTLESLEFSSCDEYYRADRLLSCLSNFGRLRHLTLHIGRSPLVASKTCVDAVKRNGSLHSVSFLKDKDCSSFGAELGLCYTKPLLNPAESRLVEAYCQRNKEMKEALRRSFPTSNDALATDEATAVVGVVAVPSINADTDVAGIEQPIGPAPALFVVAQHVPITNILFGLGMGSQTIGPSRSDALLCLESESSYDTYNASMTIKPEGCGGAASGCKAPDNMPAVEEGHGVAMSSLTTATTTEAVSTDAAGPILVDAAVTFLALPKARDRELCFENFDFDSFDLIAEGSSSKVYLQMDNFTGRKKALALHDNTQRRPVEEVVVVTMLQQHRCLNIVGWLGYEQRDCLPTDPYKVRNSGTQGRYTAIHFEYANERDVDTYITKMYKKGRFLPHGIRKAMLFQEAVGIAVLHATEGAIHQDVKEHHVLLHREEPSDKPMKIRYDIFGALFLLEMEDRHKLVPKLGGFGVAQRLIALPEHRGIARIIAPELASPEALILGNAAELSAKQDVICYGYNMIHVMSGYAAPSIILWKVRCPPSLMEQLRRHWENDEAYEIVARSIANSLDCNAKDQSGKTTVDPIHPREYLYHTVYRLLVLTAQFEREGDRFVLPALDPNSTMAQTPVWKSIDSWLDPDGPNYEQNCDQFQRDCSQFNLRKGGNTHIRRAREGLGEQGVDLVLSLLCLDPDKRPTMKQVILSAYMQEYRDPNANQVEATMDFKLLGDHDAGVAYQRPLGRVVRTVRPNQKGRSKKMKSTRRV